MSLLFNTSPYMKNILFALFFISPVVYSSNCPQNYFNGNPPVFSAMTIELCKEEFAVTYSSKQKTPFLSSIHLTKEDVARSLDVIRKNNFTQDNSLPEWLQSTVKDYTNSGFDKGHLTPFKDIAFSTDVNKLSNVVPQSPALNRGAWAQLEESIRADAVKNEEIFVMTGAIFEQGYATIGKDVPVPTHLYKVVIYPRSGEKKVFIVENSKNAVIHKISISELETISNILFPK